MNGVIRRRGMVSNSSPFPFKILKNKAVVGDDGRWNIVDREGWNVIQNIPVIGGHTFFADVKYGRHNTWGLGCGEITSDGVKLRNSWLPIQGEAQGKLGNYWQPSIVANAAYANFTIKPEAINTFTLYDITDNRIICNSKYNEKYEDLEYVHNKKRSLSIAVSQPFVLIADIAPILETTSTYGNIIGNSGSFQLAIAKQGAASNGSAAVPNKYTSGVRASVKAVVENNVGKYYLNDEYLNLDRSYTSSTITLFDGSYYMTFYIYGVKIYKNDILIYDLIPRKRLIDNSIGLYDNVSGMFYKYRYTDDPTDINV